MKSFLYRFSPGFLRSVYQRIEASPLGYRLAKGAFWSLAGSLISRGLGLISAILVGRMLGKEGFGEMGVIQNTVGMLGMLAGFGMGIAANKHIAEFKRTDTVRVGRILGLTSATTWVSSGIMSLGLLIAAPMLAARVLAAPHLTGLLCWSSFLLLLGGINGAQTGALSGFEAFKAIARINLIAGILSFPLMVVGAKYFGVQGAVFGLIATQGVNCFMNYVAVRKEAAKFKIRATYRGCMQEWSMFWGFNLPLILGNTALSVATWLAMAMLVNQHEGYAESGVLNAVLRIRQLPEAIFAMLSAPLLPLLAEAVGTQSKARFNKVLAMGFLFSILLQVPFCLFQIAWPSVTLMPYGTSYAGHESVVQWVMLQAAVAGILGPIGSAMISLGKTRFVLQVNTSYAVIYLALAWFWIPRFGAAGLAAAQVVGFVAANLFLLMLIHGDLKAVFQRLSWYRLSLFMMLVAGGCIAARGFVPLPGLIITGAISSLFIAWFAMRQLMRGDAATQAV